MKEINAKSVLNLNKVILEENNIIFLSLDYYASIHAYILMEKLV